MPQFIVVRHGRPRTERLESGIADPSLDEYGDLAGEPGVRLARPRADRRDRLQSRRPGRSRRYGRSPTRSGLPVRIVDDLDEIDRHASVYVPTDLWGTEGLDILEALAEHRWDDIGFDPPDVFRERVETVWRSLVTPTRPGSGS